MKKFPILFFALFVILINFIFLGCKKDTKNPQPTATPAPSTVYKYYPVSNELKEWGLYKVGTYWIYQTDSVLPEYDSVYVTSVTSTTKSVAYRGDTTDMAEEITVSLHHGPGYYFYNYFKLSSYNRDVIAQSYKMVESYKDYVFFNLDTTQLASQYGLGINANYTASNYTLHGTNHGAVRQVNWLYQGAVQPSNVNPPFYGAETTWKKNKGIVYDRNVPNIGNPVALIRSHIVQ